MQLVLERRICISIMSSAKIAAYTCRLPRQAIELLRRAAAAVRVAWKHDASDAGEEPVATMTGTRIQATPGARNSLLHWHIASNAHAQLQGVLLLEDVPVCLKARLANLDFEHYASCRLLHVDMLVVVVRPFVRHARRNLCLCSKCQYSATHAEVRRWAEGTLEFIECMAAQRAGGLLATARTMALCGVAGTVAYSMIGARGSLFGVYRAASASARAACPSAGYSAGLQAPVALLDRLDASMHGGCMASAADATQQ